MVILVAFLATTNAYSVNVGGLFPTHEGSGMQVSQDDAGTQHLHTFLMALDEINANPSLLNNVTLLSSVGNTMRDQDQVSLFVFFIVVASSLFRSLFFPLSQRPFSRPSDCAKTPFQMKVSGSS